MTPTDLKFRLEEKALISPIVTEAVGMVSRGVSENLAFCWSSLKLVEENESLKQQVSALKRSGRFYREDIDKLRNDIMDLKDVISLLRAGIKSEKA